jgi:UDP-glucose 4-epimerase
VDDIVEANWLAFEKASPGEVFNVGGGSRVSLNEAIDAIKEIVGREIEVHYQAVQKGDVRHTLADTTKAQEVLGYSPKVSFHEGLRSEYEWIKELVK